VTEPVPGSGDASRRAEIAALLDEIADPCSVSQGRPLGLATMGIIDRIDLADTLTIALLPTVLGCLFIGVIEERIEEALRALPWCPPIRFRHVDALWDKSRMRMPRPSPLPEKQGGELIRQILPLWR
jgi:metal-sulfur cluster biosynthetic enzyme